MGAGNTKKYDQRLVIKIITKYGFEIVKNSRGQIQGDGDHIVYKHKDFDCIKLVIPSSGTHKMLSENEMSGITGMFVIAMKILDVDVSQDFKDNQGVIGKFKKAVNRPVEALFSDFVRRILGLNDESDVNKYIKQMQTKVKEEQAQKDITKK